MFGAIFFWTHGMYTTIFILTSVNKPIAHSVLTVARRGYIAFFRVFYVFFSHFCVYTCFYNVLH